jgi:hypothetical protein
LNKLKIDFQSLIKITHFNGKSKQEIHFLNRCKVLRLVVLIQTQEMRSSALTTENQAGIPPGYRAV